MIDEKKIEELCLKGESVTLDYKVEQYKFNGNKDDKSELLKDVLSFANAWREEKGYILIGISENNGQGEIVGIQSDDIIDDANIQQFINSKTNKHIPFSCYSVIFEKGLVQVIEIDECASERPFYATKDFGNVKKGAVKIRRGTSTSDALPDEIVKMAETRIAKPQSILEAYLSPTGNSDYSKERVTLHAFDVDFENLPGNYRQNDPVRNLIDIYSTISVKDKQHWIKECFCICSVNLKLINLSDVQAKDLRIEIKIENASTKVTTLDCYPSKPQTFPFAQNVPFNNFIDKNLCIHPHDTYYEAKCVYFKPESTGTADFIVTIYGENLSKPVIFNFKIDFFVDKKILPPECLKDDFWNTLEENFVFNLLNGSDET